MKTKRYLAALVVLVLLLALLPSAALAYSLDDFCSDQECKTQGCRGASDPKHKDPKWAASYTDNTPLNLSSTGGYKDTGIIGKPGMTLNGIPFIPHVGHTGLVLISADDLLAAMNAQLLLDNDPNLTKEDLVIEDGILYLHGMKVSKWTNQDVKLLNDPFDLKGKSFALELNGQPLTSFNCSNVWQGDLNIQYYDPSYDKIVPQLVVVNPEPKCTCGSTDGAHPEDCPAYSS